MKVYKYKVSIKYLDENETTETFKVNNYDVDTKSGFLILYIIKGDFSNDDKIEYTNRYIRLDTIKEFSTTFYKDNNLYTSIYSSDVKENNIINKIVNGEGLEPLNKPNGIRNAY